MNQPIPQFIGEFLEERARNQQTVFYGEIATHFEMPPFDGIWLARPLSEMFEILDKQDAINNRPFRTSVAISREHNMPGDGFFEAMERLKEIQDPHDDQRMDIFTREITAAFAYPW